MPSLHSASVTRPHALPAAACERWPLSSNRHLPDDEHAVQLLLLMLSLQREQAQQLQQGTWPRAYVSPEELNYSVRQLAREVPALAAHGPGEGWKTGMDAELSAQQQGEQRDPTFKVEQGSRVQGGGRAAGGTGRAQRKRLAGDSAQDEAQVEEDEEEAGVPGGLGEQLARCVAVVQGTLQPPGGALQTAAAAGSAADLEALRQSSTVEIERFSTSEFRQLMLSGGLASHRSECVRMLAALGCTLFSFSPLPWLQVAAPSTWPAPISSRL